MWTKERRQTLLPKHSMYGIFAYIDPQSTTPGRFSAVRTGSPKQVVSGSWDPRDPVIGPVGWHFSHEAERSSPQPQMLHVWNICLHWGGLGGQCRHIWQSHGASGNCCPEESQVHLPGPSCRGVQWTTPHYLGFHLEGPGMFCLEHSISYLTIPD